MPRYLAFDLETARVLPEDTPDVMAHRPLGISCAAAFGDGLREPLLWYGRNADGRPAPQMRRDEVAALVRDLDACVAQGYVLVTWNGLGFDFDVLAEESGEHAACVRLALAHVDLMFDLHCRKGHPVALQKAAEAHGLPGKLAGVQGAQAPAAWAAGRHDEVLRYCAQDARLTFEVARAAEAAGALRWTTARGTQSACPLGAGWNTVAEALRLPLPDTSWMRQPVPRERFAAWLGAAPRPAAPLPDAPRPSWAPLQAALSRLRLLLSS